MKSTFLLIFVLFMVGCSQKSIPTELHKKDPTTEHTSCMLIEKTFVNKGGKVSDFTELYLRCSVQDYFIKICAGKVSASELKKYLNKGITIDMEIKDGMWDHCNENEAYSQSRMGTYAIINKIIE